MNNQYELIPSDLLTNQFTQMPKEIKKQWLAIQNQIMMDDALAELQQNHEVLQRQNEAMKRDLDIFRAEEDSRHEQLASGLRDVADASSRRLKSSDSYFARTVIGLNFVPEISAKRMTKLLRVVGIIGDHETPFAQFRSGNEPLAKPKPFAEYPTWLFHSEKTIKKINTWLTDNDHYEDFHNTTTKNDRDAFIDLLFDEIV